MNVICPQCKTANQENARFCSSCGVAFAVAPIQAKPKTNLNVIAIVAVVLLVVFLILNAATSNDRSNETNSNLQTFTSNSSQNQSDDSKLSTDERKYISAAGGYLNSMFNENKQLAQTATQVGQGTSTLGDMRDAINHTKRIENAGFFGDFGSPSVPKGFESIDGKVKKIHKMHESFIKEYLEYWNDKNVAHINSGAATQKATLLLIDETVKELTKTMKQKAEEKKKK